MNTCLVAGKGRRIGQHRPNAAYPEKFAPERIVLVHPQTTRYPHHRSIRRNVRHGGRGVAEEPLVLLRVRIASLGKTASAVGKHLLALVARIKHIAADKLVLGHRASVFTTMAMDLPHGVIGLVQQLLQRNALAPTACAGIQCTTVCPHQLRNIAAISLVPGQTLEGPHDGVIAHRPALQDDLLAQLGRILYLQHLVQTVAHHRIGKPRRDVFDRSAFAQGLLYFRVHEHRTPGSQVAGSLGPTGLLGKLLRRISQRTGKGLQKRSASRRTGFVEFHPVQSAPLDEHRLHVLPADVQDERHVGGDLACRGVMGDRLDDAMIQIERCPDQVLSIPGRTTSRNAQLPSAGLGRKAVQTLAHCPDRISLVGRIVGVQQVFVPVDGYHFGGGRSRVDPYPKFVHSVFPFPFRNIETVLLGFPLPVVLLRIEDRRQRSGHRSRRIAAALLETFPERIPGLCRPFLRTGKRRSQSRQQIGVGRGYGIFRSQMQVLFEGSAQRWYKIQRSSAKQDLGRYRHAVREGNYRLDGYRMKNGGDDVFLADIFAHQILHVGLGKHAAPRSDGIHPGRFPGQSIHFFHFDAQQRSHLVDKGPCTAGTVAVHAHVGASRLVQIHNLGIFSSDVDDCRYPGIPSTHGAYGSRDLLHERDSLPLGQSHAHRTGYRHPRLTLRQGKGDL